MNQPNTSGIIFPQDEYDDFVDMKIHTTEKLHITKNTCSEDFKIEEQEGVLRVCGAAEDKDYTKEGLRIIAELRDRTTIIIEETCKNHKKPRLGHSMGDTLGDIISDFMEKNDKIIQFPKKS